MFFWTCDFRTEAKAGDVLNVVLSLSFYEMCRVMDNSKDLLVLSTGDVTVVEGRRQ